MRSAHTYGAVATTVFEEVDAQNAFEEAADQIPENRLELEDRTPASFHSLLALVAKEYDETVTGLQAQLEHLKTKVASSQNLGSSTPKVPALIGGPKPAHHVALSPDKAVSPEWQHDVVQNDGIGFLSAPSWGDSAEAKPDMSSIESACCDLQELADTTQKFGKEASRYLGTWFEDLVPRSVHCLNPNMHHHCAWQQYWIPWLAYRSGLSEQTVEKWIEWWVDLEEPKRTGLLARVVESAAFHILALLIITANSVVMAWDLDMNMDRALKWQSSLDRVVEADDSSIDFIFTCFYIVELILHLMVHRWFFFVGKGWRYNMFDLTLVSFSIFDLVVERLDGGASKRLNPVFLRAVRFFRIVPGAMRMFRAVKAIQELRLMLECILNSMFHLAWCSLLMGSFLYMFALIIMQGVTGLVKDEVLTDSDLWTVKNHFKTVYITCVTLFMTSSGGVDWGDVYFFVGQAGAFYQSAFLVQIVFFTVLVWNVVASNMVEKAMRLALPQAEIALMDKHRLKVQYTKELTELLSEVSDADGDGYLTLEEFLTHLRNHRVRTWFEMRELDIKDPELFFHMLSNSGRVAVSTFVSACMKLRGLASSLDLQALHYDLQNSFSDFTHRVETIEGLLGQVLITQQKVSSTRRVSGNARKRDVAGGRQDASVGSPSDSKNGSLAL